MDVTENLPGAAQEEFAIFPIKLCSGQWIWGRYFYRMIGPFSYDTVSRNRSVINHNVDGTVCQRTTFTEEELFEMQLKQPLDLFKVPCILRKLEVKRFIVIVVTTAVVTTWVLLK